MLWYETTYSRFGGVTVRAGFMISLFFRLGICILFAGSTGSLAMAAETNAGRVLTSSEVDTALKVEAKANEQELARAAPFLERKALPGLNETVAGKAGKTVIIREAVAPHLSGFERAAPGLPRRAFVMRYDYATGVTTRTLVDLDAEKVIDLKAEANYPTPLAKEELDRALELARAASPELDKLLKDHPTDRELQVLVPIDNAPTSPRYGHRLAILWLEVPKATNRILVDLSDEKVVSTNY